MLKRQSGVSLIELLIGIAILAVLISFGVSSYRSWIQNSQIRNSAESVVNGLQLARAEALRRNAYVRFNLTDASSSAWTICIWDRTNNACSTAADATIQQYRPSEGSRNARLGGAASEATALTTALASGAGLPGGVMFSGFGRPADPGNDLMRIDVLNPSIDASEQRRLVIRVSLGGQVRMCDPKLSASTSPQGCV